jgi:lipopolysaccharide heptosyltransferase II
VRAPRGYRNYSRRARWIAWGLDLAAAPMAPLLGVLAPRGACPPAPRSILVVRLDHLGDVLMSTPAIAALRRAFPEARIDALAAPWGRAALLGNPDVARILEAPAPWYDPQRGDVPAPQEVLSVAARLRREAYDWAFDLRGDPRVVALYLLPAARRRFGFSGLGLERLLTDALPYDRRRSMLDLALDLASAAGAPAAPRRPVFDVEDRDRCDAAELLEGDARLRSGERFVVVAPGSNRAAARWPSKRFAEVGDGLEREGYRVVLSGREADAPVTSDVAKSMGRRPHDLTGRTRLATLAATLERAALLVANDSGASHLAAAVGCPTVAVFGPTDPSLTFPYEDGERFVSVAAAIDHERPCFDLSCDSDHGFGAIPAARVLEICLRVLRRARTPAS